MGRIDPEPLAIVVIGVAGCGKSTFGRALAERLHGSFIEGDSLHPDSNVEKMSSGTALIDDDREPWLDAIGREAKRFPRVVMACSALKQSYRHRLLAHRPDIQFVYLHASREALVSRLSRRPDHFFSPALLDSQLADLEEPVDALVLDAGQAIEDLVEQTRTWIHAP